MEGTVLRGHRRGHKLRPGRMDQERCQPFPPEVDIIPKEMRVDWPVQEGSLPPPWGGKGLKEHLEYLVQYGIPFYPGRKCKPLDHSMEKLELGSSMKCSNVR